MAVLFCMSSFFFTFLIFFLRSTGKEGLRSAFIKTSLVHGLMIAVSTELLSFFAVFQFNFVLGLWGATCAITAAGALYLLQVERKPDRTFVTIFSNLRATFQTLDAIERYCLIGVGAILATTLTTALFSPPNTMDSMSYHMPRVMHWIQNTSIAHYPTNDVRQISFQPGAEYAVAHLVILTGNDYFANIVQWISFFGCVLGTSLIAANFSSRKGQILSALFCATIPMAILQSTTTQTDLIAAFWLVCGVFFIFRSKRYSWADMTWISLSFSLAVLTKPTAYFFGFPLGVVLTLRYAQSLIKSGNFSIVAPKVLIMVCYVGVGSILLSGPSCWRNENTFGNLIGPDGGTQNAVVGLKPFVSNLTRNIALNLPLPSYWRWVETVHTTILDLDVDDERTTFEGNSFSNCPEWLFLLPDEDFAGYPVHLLLFVVTSGMILVRRFVRKDQKLNGMLILSCAVLGGFFIFSLLIKWQIWGNRLHLAAYILLSPVAASVFANSRRPLLVILVGVLVIQGAAYSLFAIRHPLISLQRFESPIFRSASVFQASRENLYFNGNFEYMKKPLQELNERVRSDNCKTLGITLSRPEFEYPVWAVLNNGRDDKVKIKHLGVKNPSQYLAQEFSHKDMCATAEIETNKVNYTILH